jgi:hypothetical protein
MNVCDDTILIRGMRNPSLNNAEPIIDAFTRIQQFHVRRAACAAISNMCNGAGPPAGIIIRRPVDREALKMIRDKTPITSSLIPSGDAGWFTQWPATDMAVTSFENSSIFH